MNYEHIYTKLKQDLSNERNCQLSSWDGGMEHRNIQKDEANIQILKKYILNWKTQKLFAKLPRYISLDADCIKFSANLHQHVLKDYFRDNEYDSGFGDLLNAQDFYFLFTLCNIYTPNKKLNVLDFGAGYGRCINFLLYSDYHIQYTAIDAVPSSYLAQFLYLRSIAQYKKLTFYEFYSEEEFEKNAILSHYPTWELDKIETGSHDLILCNHVLPELPEHVFRFVVEQIIRILKVGGKLYIRDHDLSWMPGHTFNIDEVLINNGFIKTYELFEIDQNTIHGIPRVYAKTNKIFSPHKISQKSVKRFY